MNGFAEVGRRRMKDPGSIELSFSSKALRKNSVAQKPHKYWARRKLLSFLLLLVVCTVSLLGTRWALTGPSGKKETTITDTAAARSAAVDGLPREETESGQVDSSSHTSVSPDSGAAADSGSLKENSSQGLDRQELKASTEKSSPRLDSSVLHAQDSAQGEGQEGHWEQGGSRSGATDGADRKVLLEGAKEKKEADAGVDRVVDFQTQGSGQQRQEQLHEEGLNSLSAQCLASRSLSTCGAVAAVVHAQDDIASRLAALCGAQALSALSALRLRVLWSLEPLGRAEAPQVQRLRQSAAPAPLRWPEDSPMEPLGGARFDALFAETGLDVQDDVREFGLVPEGHERRVLRVKPCGRPSRQPGVGPGPFGLNPVRDWERVTPDKRESARFRHWAGQGQDRLLELELVARPTVLDDLQQLLSNNSHSCRFDVPFRQCLGSLRPSAAVQELMDSEDVAWVQKSTAVYLEPQANWQRPEARAIKCQGCRPYETLNCTVRRLAYRMLRDPGGPDSSFTVGSHFPEEAEAVEQSFDPNSGPPRMLKVTRLRLQKCLRLPQLVVRRAEMTKKVQDEYKERRMQGRMRDPGSALLSRVRVGTLPLHLAGRHSEGGPGLGGRQRFPDLKMRSLGREDLSSRLGQQARALRRLQRSRVGGAASRHLLSGETSEGALPAPVEQIEKLVAGPGGGGEGGLVEGARIWTGADWPRRSQEESGKSFSSAQAQGMQLCAQFKVAELFALSLARALLHVRYSVAAEFIASQGRARRKGAGEGGAGSGAGDGNGESEMLVEDSVCDTLPLVPLNQMRTARHMIVDEGLKLVYCSIPKTGCTSWKMWFREQHGDQTEDVKDPVAAHNPKYSHLGELWYAYNEPDAIRVLTRRDLFKFVFVRNPFSRVLSVYFNKHVKGGVKPFNRRLWNNEFFGRGNPRLRDLADGTGLLSFPNFVQLLADKRREDRRNLEPHIALQVDVCSLDFIKFDFVGRFEHLERDASVILERVKRPRGQAFDFGKDAHPTAADAKLTASYTKEAYDLVKGIYEEDMTCSLNNVTFTPPPVLAQEFGK